MDSSGAGQIHICRWDPVFGKPKGVLQIIHGIGEYAARYDEFARLYTDHGFVVIADDHMGHGESVSEDGIRGYFSGGWFAAVEDSYRIYKSIREELSEVPYVMFGHSMGSFMLRTMLIQFPDMSISGAVLCGTAWIPETALQAGYSLSVKMCKQYGETASGSKLQNLIFRAYNRRVERPQTSYDWINRNHREVKKFIEDPLCVKQISAGLMRDMISGMLYMQDSDNLEKMDKSLPVLFVAGGDDPVGDFGSGVRKTAEAFIATGVDDVTVKIYPLCRHEILREINKTEIFEDILMWTFERVRNIGQ